ncbi:MAG: glycosyltransferase family 2 protein [Simkaniaceae bacterium]|nr:glycosyltransferase family 2 protein [Simkaniaceae bacterium]
MISIIVPTYNRGYTIWKTIQSIQKQSHTDWELWVIDDGSTDNTKKVIDQFQDDPRIHYHYKANGGVSSARNVGLTLAKGQWISYVDSDDEIYPHYLETALKEIPAGKSYAFANGKRILELYEDGRLKKALANDCKIASPTLQDFYDWKIKASLGTGFFHKRSLNVSWNEELELMENLDFMMKCSLADPEGYHYISEELYVYKQRYGGDGICSNASYQDWADSFLKVYELHKSDPLMQNPSVYQSRVEKYQLLHKQHAEGKVPDPVYKFFS